MVHASRINPGGAVVSLVSGLRAQLLRKPSHYADTSSARLRDNLFPPKVLATHRGAQSHDDVGNFYLPARNQLQRLVFRLGY